MYNSIIYNIQYIIYNITPDVKHQLKTRILSPAQKLNLNLASAQTWNQNTTLIKPTHLNHPLR